MLTNSPFKFVDRGMTELMSGSLHSGYTSWKDFFDLIICKANKPSFFISKQPFRHFNTTTLSPHWGRIDNFKKSEVYVQGKHCQLFFQVKKNLFIYLFIFKKYRKCEGFDNFNCASLFSIYKFLKDFSKFIKVPGSKILFFGDHLSNDLEEPIKGEGWKTGVIIHEVNKSILSYH